MRFVILSLLGSSLLFAGPVEHSLSFQGYTGLVNIPNAQVMNEGDISFSFNNQFDNHLRNYDYTKPKDYAEDYIFGVGFLPNFEFQGRFKEQKGYTRDLSANFKYKIPRLMDETYFPDIAIGVQDLGSAANNYENYYIVADKSIWLLRASLGYGYSNNSGASKAPRMDGVFGGLEAQVTPWLSLMGEYDTKETHVGARFFMPEEWIEGLKFHFTVASNLDDGGDTSVMFNAILPLGKHDTYIMKNNGEEEHVSSPIEGKQKSSSITAPSNESDVQDISLMSLAEALRADGLQNVTVGSKGNVLYIGYENTVYLHNELDAIGAVLREAIKFADKYTRFVIEPKHSNVVVTALSGSLVQAAAFYRNPSFETKQAFITSLKEGKSIIKDWEYATVNMNSSRFRPRVELTPVLTTFVGTELSAFDYQLLLGTRAYINLYDGLDFTFRYDAPISYSDNLDPITGAFKYAYSDGGWYSTMLNYSNRIGNGLNTLSAGSYKYDYVGVMDQFIYHKDRSTLKFKVGYFQNYDYSDDTKEVYLAKYSYHYEPMDLFAEVQVGQYWYQDVGFSLSLKRYFRDVAVELKYLQTKDPGNFYQSEETNKYVGVAIELPLDFRKSKLSGKYGQINGDTAWRYRLRSTVGRSDGSNRIVPNSGYDPIMEIESEKYFYNRNRLSEGYIKENAERLLESF